MIFSAAPAKRRLEILYLAYLPIWIGVIAYLMFTHRFAGWGDVGHLVLGVACAVPPIVLPILFPSASERATPYWQRYSTKAVVFLIVMSVLQNHFGSWFFFHSLGMQYHFPVTWIARDVPVFLHLLTVAYFSTYYTLMQLGLGAYDARAKSSSRALRWLVIGGLSYAMAFGETFFMDVPILREYFSYADRSRALWFGSIAYGTLFVCSLPIYYALDEKTTWKPFLWRLLGCNMLILIAYEIYAAIMGPAAR